MAGVVRRLAYAKDRTYKTYSSYVEFAPPEVAANTVLCLIHQSNYLIDQQIRELEQAFLEQGGFTERLYRARTAARQFPPADSPTPPNNRKPANWP